MNNLAFIVSDWHEITDARDPVSLTQASLSISVDVDGKSVALTEVHDTLAQTVRAHIYVPVYPLARWLLVNWWRLRWEPEPGVLDQEWDLAHSIGSLGQGVAWPPIVFASDGAFVQIRVTAEQQPDMAGIRYLRDGVFDIPAECFEAAVDRIVWMVEERLDACRCDDRVLSDLRLELAGETSDPVLNRTCRLQALAGIDPGDVAEDWISEVDSLERVVGTSAVEEIVAMLPRFDRRLSGIDQALDRIRRSPTEVDISGVPHDASTRIRELPWQRGERLAREVRARFSFNEMDVVSNDVLGEVLKVALPLHETENVLVGGGFRTNATGRTKIVVPSHHPTSQRFYLARLIGCAAMAPSEENLLPITRAATALQKGERAFAQEFLCPWSALEAFVDENGIDEDGVSKAADHFQISDWAVRSSLVNHGKMPRECLPAQLR